MSSPVKKSTSHISPMKSSSSLSSLNSFKNNECNPVKNVSNYKSSRSLYSSDSLHIKKRTERPSFTDSYDNHPNESQTSSQISLYSLGSLTIDDFNWSTFRPNYLKMMNDTNLLDSCAEAKQEMESIRQQSCSRRLEFFETDKSKNKQIVVDAEQLLKWIAYMEKYLETFSPSWIEVKKMNSIERNTRLNEQCDLRQYIASHNRIVSEMIKEQDNQRTRNIKEKYQALLLNAIEKQCLLEGYPELDDHHKSKYENEDDVKLDVYKLCSIDIEPQYNSNQLMDYTITQSSESLAMKSDATTIMTSDEGIHFPIQPTTSKSSLFSEDDHSLISSNRDFRPQYESLDNLIKELNDIDINHSHPASDVVQNNRKNSNSSIRQSTLKLIEDVDLILPKVPIPNIDEYAVANKKVDNWLLMHPLQQTLQLKENQTIKVNPDVHDVGIMDQQSFSTESDQSSFGNNVSVGQQWDNFQDFYTLTAPYYIDTSDDFLYFGDDYDDVLKCKSGSTISSTPEIVKAISIPSTSPSKSEKSSEITDIPIEVVSISRKRKRISRKIIKEKTVIMEKSISYDNSEMARDILLITEDLRNNYMNVKPKDFDRILKICRQNLGCLIVVLDKEQKSHGSIESIECVDCDDKIYIQENCRCGIIGRFVGGIVNFLYKCSRKVRKSAIYKFLMKMLKGLYSMVKFLSERVRVYRNYYGKF